MGFESPLAHTFDQQKHNSGIRLMPTNAHRVLGWAP